jgi:Flp pilus assembly protein TadD
VAVATDDLVDHKSEGERLLAAGKVDDAIAEFKRALSVDSSADVWAALGEAYLRAGTIDRGVGCLEEAVAVDVDHKAARKLLVRHYLSAQAGTLARLHAEEWVRLAPQDPAARQAMGRAFSQVGMWKEAIDEFALVVEVQPDNAFACNNLGFAALQVGENERAVQSLERVLSLKPQQGFMLNNLGVAYERVGRTAEAHAAFARAAELSPRYAQAALNRDRVQKGLDHAQRIVSTDALLRLRDGGAFDTAPLGTGPADGVLAVPGLPSFDGE